MAEKKKVCGTRYVRFGELSVRVASARADRVLGTTPTEAVRADGTKITVRKELKATFLRRFMWRDLAYWSLWRFPQAPGLSLRVQYEEERWAGTPRQLRAWQRGRTGVPLVDAAMRQLWRLGWRPTPAARVSRARSKAGDKGVYALAWPSVW